MTEDAIALGKRKDRQEESEAQTGSTLFVSNLPYSATSTDLKTLFSDLAPVRTAFVVLEENVSKGVGYVSFAIKEDARTALETIEKDGLEMNGRKLRVEMADRKPKEKTTEKKVKSERETPRVPRTPHLKAAKDPNAIRTIVITGLPTSVDKKALWKKVRKIDGAESVELVEAESGVANVLFKNPASAARAVDKLHAHVFKGSILSVTLKKRLENLAKAPMKGEDTSSSVIPTRSSRLIVRNLPWNITEKDLRALFLPYGPVYSITIPTEKSTSDGSKTEKQRAKGFAFVWFFSKKDAERAIAGANGRAVEAGAIVAPTMNKKERQRLRRQMREKAESEGVEKPEGVEESDEEIQDNEAEKETSESRGSKARILAVDWALSKDRWEEVKSKMLDEGVEEGAESVEKESDILSETDLDESSEGRKDSDDQGDSVGEDAVDDERPDAEEATKPSLPLTDVGTTLFVRNVPFEAVEDELRTLFRAFGPLRYARITVDIDTGRSRGTGFVCFWNRDDADKAIVQSELLSRETGTDSPAAKKNPFSLPSLLTPDPSSSLAQSLVLHGRTLDVTRAVTRETAVRLKDEGERQREKADKRNLYLLREGVILPGTPAEATVSPAELEKRTTSFNTRRALLKSNPSLYVSKTRLSIRQLPLSVSDRALKRLGIHAVRAFEEEVKRGQRQSLSQDELRADDDVQPGDDSAKAKMKHKRKGERETGVTQAKVVRQADRIDALTGKGRSRGYGFLEMRRHSDALRVLRWANNNQALGPLLEGWWKSEIEDIIKALKENFGKADDREDVEARIRRLRRELEHLESKEGRSAKKTLIVEFSIENAQVVNRRKEKTELTKAAPKRSRSNAEADGDGDREAADTKPVKRRKVENSAKTKNGPTLDVKPVSSDSEVQKPRNALGSIIGRKRKMRKTKAKA